jgi:Mn-dependent DtxR family transcriptional regulator
MLPFNEEQKSLNKGALDDETLLSGQFWGELRVFLAVAKTKSFNRAAEILNTSQPRVSRQVKRLQDIVGSQLFLSTPRGVKLTQKGEALARARPARSYALFHHQRFADGDQRTRRHRARQHHRCIERSVCCALTAAILRSVSENSTASEKPTQSRQLARESNGYDDRTCPKSII